MANPNGDYWAKPSGAQNGQLFNTGTGDVAVENSLGAFGKAACAAVGMADETVEANIAAGKQVAAALA